MIRRDFLKRAALGALSLSGLHSREFSADVAVIGGGLGGCAAALAALEQGCSVVMTEPTDWIGGQVTQQGVPPDEHRWIESFGATRSYRAFRSMWRTHYRMRYPLAPAGPDAANLNPGSCLVSRLCAEPSVALHVLRSLLELYRERGQLRIFLFAEPIGAEVAGDRILAVRVRTQAGEVDVHAPMFVEATEDGALLPLAGVEHVSGAEPDTGELHASNNASPENMQSATWCFAIEYREGEVHTIERPVDYDYWAQYVPRLSPSWPGKLFSLTYTHPITLEPREASFDPRPGAKTRHFNLWTYRRLIHPNNFVPGKYAGGISLVNWPQNDYMDGNLSGSAQHQAGARQLSLSLLYWLQTAVPREDGRVGWPGLRPCGEVLGTSDGLAKAPYLRESRRIKARYTVLEDHVGKESRGAPKAAHFEDSVGIGYYRIDLHPSTGGDNYIDVDSLPFEIPLGAMIPQRVQNLLPACKNIGTTHITNGCYRLHPVEWNIGECAGTLAAFCKRFSTSPHAVYDTPALLPRFQRSLEARGVELRWPSDLN